jgi:outer membrane PBP1 activator LpoA protein
MIRLNHVVRIALYIVALMMELTACTTALPPRDEAVQDEAAEMLEYGDRKAAAALLWEQAKAAKSPQREDLQLRAVEAVLTPKTLLLARAYLSMIPEENLRGSLLVRARIAKAKLALMRGRPNVALAALPAGIGLTTPAFEARVEDLRAQALLASGQILESVRVRSALAAKLTDPRAIKANRQRLWKALGRASDREVLRWVQEATSDILRGWLELSYISKTSPSDMRAFDQLLDAWRQRYPGHPATDAIAEQLRKDWQSLQLRPRQIAVMLPLSGAYASIAEAVLAGFMAAHYTHDEVTGKPVIRVYDLGDNSAAAWDQYMQAVQDGADLVIGPLDKEGVAVLVQHQKLPVPVLSLNYTDEVINPPDNLYQFGLLPEDEARQVAERASLAGHQTAVALAPQGEWGERLLKAFRTRFKELGGEVLDVARYDAESTDYSTPIKDVLGIDSSEERNSQLRALLKRDLQFEPNHRPDADMVFMVALPREARLLRPQLRFHYASDLPVYATSHIYTGIEDLASDRDINGVIYCDMPWTIEGANPKPQLRARLDSLFPQASQQLPRLTALGFDAYQVIDYLKRLAERPYERYAGLTGNLHMDELGRIHRELKWAQFVDGEPRVMDSLVAQTGRGAFASAP